MRAEQSRELAARPAAGELIDGVLLGGMLLVALMAALAVAGLYDISSTGTGCDWTGLALATQAAASEELWTRALAFRQRSRAFGPMTALLISALGFAALHLSNPGATLLSVTTVGAAGLVSCGWYARTGRLWLTVGATSRGTSSTARCSARPCPEVTSAARCW